MLDIKPTTAKKALQKPCPYCEERLKRPKLAISPSDVVIDEKGNAKPAAAYVCRHHLLCSHIYGAFAAAESHRLIWFELANARRGQITDHRPTIRHKSLRGRVVAKLIAAPLEICRRENGRHTEAAEKGGASTSDDQLKLKPAECRRGP